MLVIEVQRVEQNLWDRAEFSVGAGLRDGRRPRDIIAERRKASFCRQGGNIRRVRDKASVILGRNERLLRGGFHIRHPVRDR